MIMLAAATVWVSPLSLRFTAPANSPTPPAMMPAMPVGAVGEIRFSAMVASEAPLARIDVTAYVALTSSSSINPGPSYAG
jgi:hypothetical protein